MADILMSAFFIQLSDNRKIAIYMVLRRVYHVSCSLGEDADATYIQTQINFYYYFPVGSAHYSEHDFVL